MHKDPLALIVRKKSWGDYHLLALKSPRIAREARPGQFLMVRVNDQPHPLLRRPFSIHARDRDVLDIFFARTGVGTAILAGKKAGQTLDILGPLGKGFRIAKKVRGRFVVDEELKGKTAFLTGGGRGIAPLYFLAHELRARGVRARILYGGQTKADLPLLQKFRAEKFEVLTSTDDGSLGFHGFVSALLEEEIGRSNLPVYIYACGPDPMMKTIAELANRRRIPAQFSLEAVMGCGIGACWGCVKRIKRGRKDEWLKICEEGPVFAASEIVWEEE